MSPKSEPVADYYDTNTPGVGYDTADVGYDAPGVGYDSSGVGYDAVDGASSTHLLDDIVSNTLDHGTSQVSRGLWCTLTLK